MTEMINQEKRSNVRRSASTVQAFKESNIKKNIPGLLMVFIIAYISQSVGKDIPLLGSTVTAILLGVLIRNFIGMPTVFSPGIQYSLKSVLKLAIILLGTSLNLVQVFTIGSQSIVVISAVVILGIILTIGIGRWMGLSGNIPALIGVGTAICGATAIAAISPIMKSKEEETAFAITTIFIFNIIAVILYPIIGVLTGMNDEVFGMWAGAAIHDTSSVVAASFAYSDEAGGIATVVKLTRTLFLIPLALLIGIYISSRASKEGGTLSGVKISKIFPWFLLGFLAMSVLNTLGMFSESAVQNITQTSKFMILMAMASVGLGVNFKQIKEIGLKPIYLGLIASLIVALVSILIIYLIL
ncbi:YeiH family protein [Planococcus salinus]|uniref:Putative sulfate exporter family transporter n=1 Tax=Planococcus salinus TaxID=1848460 RepID=A0A3M8P8Y4_9BACL|nr:putative sulfate exporter family transporter [Planococcus salinus]RNF39720.1 putative sulfate exporter family transporter [Planococcus salinus]